MRHLTFVQCLTDYNIICLCLVRQPRVWAPVDWTYPLSVLIIAVIIEFIIHLYSRRSTDIIGHLLYIVCAFSCFHNWSELYVTVQGSDQLCNPLYINILMLVLCIHVCFVDTTLVLSSSVDFFWWYIRKCRFQTPYTRITSTAVCTLNFEHG